MKVFYQLPFLFSILILLLSFFQPITLWQILFLLSLTFSLVLKIIEKRKIPLDSFFFFLLFIYPLEFEIFQWLAFCYVFYKSFLYVGGLGKALIFLYHYFFKKTSFTAPQIFLLSYLLLILFCFLFLQFDVFTKISLPFIDQIYIAVSLVTVTCMLPGNLTEIFTDQGLYFVLFFVQLGGLGIMTLSSVAIVFLGEKMGLKEKIFVGEVLNIKGSSLRDLLKSIFIYTLIFEFIGGIILTSYFYFIEQMHLKKAFFQGLFHSVTAFCQSGLKITSSDHTFFQMSLFFLMLLGSLGFFVLRESYLYLRKKIPFLSLQSKVAFTGSFVILVTSTFLIFFFEWFQEGRRDGFVNHLFSSLIYSMSSRTSGFTFDELNSLQPVTLYLFLILMFIGGNSGSTSGGVKVSTIVVLFQALKSLLNEEKKMHLFQRGLSFNLILKAVTLFFLALSLFIIAFLFLLYLEPHQNFFPLFFETMASFSTTGFSLGILPTLQPLSKMILGILMIIGKIGPLTFLFALRTKKEKTERIFYPEEDFMIG